MKKLCSISMLLVAIIISVLCLTACVGNAKTLKGIEIAEGSFKDTYVVNEQLQLGNAKLMLIYDDGSKEPISITANMISGFDTATTSAERVIKITYLGFSKSVIYRVVSGEVVETGARLALQQEQTANGAMLKVKLENSASEPSGVYALSFSVKLVGATYTDTIFTLANGIDAKISYASNILKVIIFSKNGATKIEDGFLADIELINIAVSATASAENIKLSDGVADKRMPAVAITLAAK